MVIWEAKQITGGRIIYIYKFSLWENLAILHVGSAFSWGLIYTKCICSSYLGCFIR